MQEKTLGHEKIIGRTVAQIIPTIVSGLYNDKYDIAREYCQNGYDAILKRYGGKDTNKGKIDISIKGTTIYVHDNGTGMVREVVLRLAEIGYSTKDTWNQVGYRGIGRLAGICGAKKLIFITKASNEPVEHSFSIDAGSLVAALDRNTKFNEDAGKLLARFSSHSIKSTPSAKSYTTVVLENIYGEAGKMLSGEGLRNYLELNLPIPINPQFSFADAINALYSQYEKNFPNIKISLNDYLIYKPFHELPDELEMETIELNNSRGKLLGVAWYVWLPNRPAMLVNDRFRGLRLRHRGFTIGQAHDLRDLLQTSPIQVADWFAGEVIVLDERARVSSDRSRFEDTEARTELLFVIRNKLGNKLSKIARNVSGKMSKKRVFLSGETLKKEITQIASGKKHISEQSVNKKIEELHRVKYKLKTIKAKAKKKPEIDKAQNLINDLNSVLVLNEKHKSEKKNVARQCKLSKNGQDVYRTIIIAIGKYYSTTSSAEDLITYIENDLLRKFGRG